MPITDIGQILKDYIDQALPLAIADYFAANPGNSTPPPTTPAPPSWNSQSGSGWAAQQAALQYSASKFTLKSIGSMTCTPITLAGLPPGDNKYSSAASLPGRRFVLGPHTTANTVMSISRVFDADTFIGIDGAEHGDGPSRTNGIRVFENLDVFPVPSMTTTGKTLHLGTNSAASTFPGIAPSGSAYLGSFLMPDGISIGLVPHNASYIRIVNTITGAYRDITSVNFGGNAALAGGVLTKTAEILLIPHNYDKWMAFNPVTETFRFIGNAPGGEAYCGGVTMDHGPVYAAAHKAACSAVIDVEAGTITNTLPPDGSDFVAPIAGQANFRLCLRLMNGWVLLINFKHTRAWLFNPATNRHIQLPFVFAFGAVACAVMLPNGDPLLVPWNGTQAYRLSLMTATPGYITPEILYCGPMHNGF